jgi:hypothetical protein
LKGNRNKYKNINSSNNNASVLQKKIGWWFFEAEGNESSFCYDSMARE